MKSTQPPPTPDTELEEFRTLLGPELANQYTDGQLRQLRRDMYDLADLLLDVFLAKRREATPSKEPSRPST
jgi:hypothetical protein